MILYDFKQSSRAWYDTLKTFMFSLDYVRLLFDHFVFINENDMMIAIFVDDLLIADSKINEIIVFKIQLTKCFRIKNLDSVLFYLNIKMIRNWATKKMFLIQTIFIDQLINDYDFENKCRFVNTFMG